MAADGPGISFDLRARMRPYRFAIAACIGLVVGLAAMAWNGELSHDVAHHQAGPVPLRTSASIGDLSMAVMGYQRLRDGHAGVNSARLPMSGPAMPSSTMGEIGGALERGQEQIVVNVALRNPGDTPRGYDAGRFLLVKNGREVPLLQRTRSTLGAGRLMALTRISGSIYFVVKPGTAPLELRDVATDTVFRLDREATVGPGGSTNASAPSAAAHGH